METTKAQRQDLAVPADKATRDRIRRALETSGFSGPIVPPLALEEIEAHTDRLIRELDLDLSYRGFVTLLVGNGIWRDTVAATPFGRRILLLPQCLRSSTACSATFDSLGLLCEGCGQCSIDVIQQEAEDLGYVVLVAEGTTAVSELVTRGEADAVVGVSCMQALEKFFHPLNAHAVPGLAVPLLGNGCVDTRVDLDWIRETLRLRGPDRLGARRLNVQALRREVCGWFEPGLLAGLMKGSGTETEAITVEWLARGGKRWRPTLTAGAFQSLAGSDAIPDRVRKAAVAVECFHKASLIHDDLEDDDDVRYGTPTFHRQHGVAVAINAGDLLIGEGYRLLADSGASPEQMARMLAAATAGHRMLCIGQGEELLLRATPERLTVPVVLGIFQRKTAPAYDIALQLGAICADADPETCAVLTAYSEALGIAYQIRDDLDDTLAAHPVRGVAGQPSLLAALARESFPSEASVSAAGLPAECLRDPRVEQQARLLLREYADRALRSLAPLRHAALKSLLYRVVSKIVDPAP